MQALGSQIWFRSGHHHDTLRQFNVRRFCLLTKSRPCAQQAQQVEGEGGDGSQLDTLREDVDAALAEAASAQERQQLLQLEVTDLQRQRNELTARIEELAAEQVRGEVRKRTDKQQFALVKQIRLRIFPFM